MLAAPQLQAHGADVTVTEVLQIAGQQLGTDTLTEEQAARLHYTLATSYASLALYDLAEVHFVASAGLTDQARASVAVLMKRLQMAIRETKFDKAAALLKEVDELASLRQSELPSYYPQYVALQAGVLDHYRGEHAAASERLLKLEKATESFPPEHEANHQLWEVLANMFRDEADFENALAYARKALNWHEVSGDGRDSFGALLSRHNMVTALVTSNRVDEAVRLGEENLAQLDAIDSRWTVHRVGISLVLIDAIRQQGRTEEALQRFIALRDRARGEENVTPRGMLAIVGQFGPTYFELGRFVEAEAATREALAIAVELMGSESSLARLYSSNIAEFMVYQNRGDEALSYARDVYHENLRLFGGTHLFTLFAGDVYGVALVRWGSVRDGLELLDRTLSLKKDQFGVDNIFTWETQKGRIEGLTAQGQLQEARQLAQEVHDAFVGELGAHHHKSTVVEKLLIALQKNS